MAQRDEEHVIEGKPSLDIPKISFGKYILDKLRSNPLRIIMVDGLTEKTMTNRELLEKSVKLAVILGERGVKVGDIVAISAENHINWFVAACATMFRGATLTALNPDYSEGEILHCLNITKPRMIFVSNHSESLIKKVSNKLPWKMEIVQLDETSRSRNIPSLSELLNQSRNWPDPYIYQAVDIENPKEQPLIILYSSGTTGLPKGVMLSHHNIFTRTLAAQQPDVLNINQNEVMLTVLPFFHGYGFSIVIDGIHVGATTVILSSFKPEIYLSLIGRYKVSGIFVAPPMMNFFANSPLVIKYDYSSLNFIVCGAAPLPPEIRQKALQRMGNPIFRNGYGMTELSVVVSLTARDSTKPESVGILFPGARCKVIDLETSRSLSAGNTGEICVKGDYVMIGYKDNPQATRETIDPDGWLHTGDLGYFDQHGDLFIIGRLKELIKYKGFQVSPSEIESLLLSHPDLSDAAVVGKPDEEAGELPMAFVVRRPDSKITSSEVVQFVNDRVSPQSRLRAGVHFVKAIPKNPGGKILRRELLKLVAKL